MNIIVTGGAGFIGSSLIDRLLKLPGIIVYCLDNFDDFYSIEIKKRNISEHLQNPNFRLLQADICDLASLKKVLPGSADVIVHFAAKAGVRPSILDPVKYQQVNVLGTQNLLEIAKEFSIRKFVFASSSSVYGTNSHVPWKESDLDLKPISPYASTKLSCEFMAHVYSYLYGIQFIGLRFFTVYGPRQRPDLAIHKFFSKLYQGLPLDIYGNGSTMRDYTYIGDALNGIMSALKYDASQFELINIGSNSPIKLLDLIAAIERVSGKKALLNFREDQPGDVPVTYADTSKAYELLGFSNSTPILKGLDEFHQWFKKMES